MIKVLGDVHLGRKFINDVPLHRRGDRERLVWAQFEEELKVPLGVTAHIQLGDLFDSFDVDNSTILKACEAYIEAARSNSECCYYLYPGNHDLSRDVNKVSAFQLFAKIVISVCKNITVFWGPDSFEDEGKHYAVMPWSPFRTAQEQAETLALKGEKFEAVFTHCDIQDFGGSNVLPTQSLCRVTEKVINGHVHKPSEFTRDGLSVVNYGSMQPYSHAEDSCALWYKTFSLNEFLETEQSSLKNVYVRIRLKPGETAPEAPDCLGFKVVQVEDEKEENIDVAFEDFNVQVLFEQCLKDAEVSATLRRTMLEKFNVSQT